MRVLLPPSAAGVDCWGSVESEARGQVGHRLKEPSPGNDLQALRKAVVCSSQDLRFSQARSTTKGPEIALRLRAHGAGRAAARARAVRTSTAPLCWGGPGALPAQAGPPASDSWEEMWAMAGLSGRTKPLVRR